MRRIIICLFAVALFGLFVTCLAPDANATHPHHGFGRFGGLFPYNNFAYGNGYWPYTLGFVPVPPYYALHPPVYYSAPVPRTYGYSPYPYPGHVRTPDVAATPKPKDIINPHVEPKAKKTANRVTRVKPKVIINHYVTSVPAQTEGLALVD